jgi:hypothetical protein
MKSDLFASLPRLDPFVRRAGSVAVWLGILPFFVLCWYAHPSADDFLQANDVRKHGHGGYLHYMYLNWTGRYTAMLGWSFLNPVSYGNDKAGYGLVCLLLLLLLLISLVLVLRTMLQGAGLTARQLWQAGAAAMLLFVYQLPSTAEGFYWLTSGFNYLLPGILLLLALAALAMYVQKPPTRRLFYFAAATLLFLTVGCNETIAVPVFLTTWGVVLIESKRQRKLVGAWVAVVVSVGCAAAFLAPGNAARMQELEKDLPGPLITVLLIVKYTVYCLINWLGNGVLVVVTLLLIPAFSRLARIPQLPLNQFVRHPLLLTLLVPAFLAAGLFPAFWVAGNPAPSRAQDMLYLCFITSWMLAAYSWVFYAVHRSYAPLTSLELPAFARWCLLAWLPLTFLTDYNHHFWDPGYRFSTNNPLLAYRDLLHGRAAQYDQELTSRYHYLRSSWGDAHVQVAPLTSLPVTLYFTDISLDSANWDNRAYAEFFGKKTIRVAPQPVGK